MIDDILAGIFGEVVLGRAGSSKRAQLLARLFFGLLGAALSVAGAAQFHVRNTGRHTAMTLSVVAMFVFLTCFFLLNVALARKWRWPGVLFVISFVSLLATSVLVPR
jgi:hypothetical protein